MIILYGGTFDPIHNGHLHIASCVYKLFKPHRFIFIPAKQSPHRQQTHATASDRINMLQLALSNLTHFEIDDFECQQEGLSFTLRTVEYFHQQTKLPLYWLMGADAFEQFERWHNPSAILKLANLIIVNRDNNDIQQPSLPITLLKQWEHLPCTTGHGLVLSTPAHSANATAIRETFQNNNIPPKAWLPESVASYINAHNLYR